MQIRRKEKKCTQSDFEPTCCWKHPKLEPLNPSQVSVKCSKGTRCDPQRDNVRTFKKHSSEIAAKDVWLRPERYRFLDEILKNWPRVTGRNLLLDEQSSAVRDNHSEAEVFKKDA
jgi:hypothetical protein